MLELLVAPMSSTDIINIVEQRASVTKRDLISLYLREIIRPIGFHEGYSPRTNFFQQDFIWTLTDHGRNHRHDVPGCRACRYRAELILASAPDNL